MSQGLNKVFLLGNLGADPELKIVSNGNSVLKMSMATTETWKDDRGNKQERTEWHRITLWGKRADALAKILSKGERIFVEGSIRTSSYEKDGVKRYSTEIVAKDIILNGRSGNTQSDASEATATSNNDVDEGLPF